MPSLVEKLPHYSVKQLPCTCSMFEIGDFSSMHAMKYSIEYKDTNFLPPSPTGLYCATFVKDDPKSDKAYEVINTSLKRIYKTLWKKSKSGDKEVRFCLFKDTNA